MRLPAITTAMLDAAHGALHPSTRAGQKPTRANLKTALHAALGAMSKDVFKAPDKKNHGKNPHGGTGGSSGGSTPPPVVDDVPASITVTPSSGSLTVGETLQLTAVVKNAAGTILAGVAVGWTSDNAPKASVDSSGLVSAVAAGSANMHATLNSPSLSSNAVAIASAAAPAFDPDAEMQRLIDGRLDGAAIVFYSGTQPASGASAAGCTALAEATGLVPAAPEGNLTSPTSMTLNVSGLCPVQTGTPTWARVVEAGGEFVADVPCVASPLTGKIDVPAFTIDTAMSLTLIVETVGSALRFSGSVSTGAVRTTPELPRVVPNFDSLYSGYMDDAAVITLQAGELLRAAVTRGAPLMDPLVPKLVVKVPAGMEVAFQAGAWMGANAAGWILFKADVALPATTNGNTLGNRIYEAQAAALNLPWLTAPDYDSAIDFEARARGYAFRGFRVRAASSTSINQAFIALGGQLANHPDTMRLDDMPSRISFRQICIVGDQGSPSGGHRRFGMQLLGSNYEIVDSVVFHINFSGIDYSQQEQSLSGYEGLGKARVKNVAGWGATEAFAWGGAGHHPPFQAAQMQPTDITLEDCHFYRPPSVKGIEGSANNGEFKVGRRVRIRRCILDGAWVDLQYGFGLSAWSADPDAPWTGTTDVTIEDSWIKDCNSGVSLSNAYQFGNGVNPRAPRRFKMRNVLFTGFNAPETYGTSGQHFGQAFLIGNHWDYTTIQHVTCVNASVVLSLDARPGTYTGLKVLDCALQGDLFIQNDGLNTGDAAYAACFGTDSEFSGNLCSTSGSTAIPNAAANTILAPGVDFGFVDGSYVVNAGTRAEHLDKCQIAGPHAGKGADAVTLKTLLTPVEIPLAYLPA